MKSEVIFTGTELLLGQILNTNAQHLQQTLASMGIDLFFQVTVGDNKKRIKEAILQASSRSDLVIICGGLGPTEDDLTREALSEALGIPLAEHPDARIITERFFKSRGIEMSSNNLKQALAPQGAVILDNPLGTAPGLALDYNRKLYVLVPGPPNEFKNMIDHQVAPMLPKRMEAAAVIRSRVLKLCGIAESKVDEMAGQLFQSRNPTLAPTAKFSEIHLRITSKASGSKEAENMNDAMEQKVMGLLGSYVYGKDNETLQQVVGKMLGDMKITLAVAETFSGGYLSHLLTSFPRCADFFKLSAVADVDGLENLLGMKISARNNPVAELAEIIREKAKADIGIAISGISGGLFPADQAVTIATSLAGRTLCKEVLLLPGDGVELRQRAVQICLVLLWHTLKKRPDGRCRLADGGIQEPGARIQNGNSLL